MVDSDEQSVRPTLRCLNDLGLKFPSLEQRLHAIDHPVAQRAQQVPAEVAAGGAERIVSLTDRVWFKVKTSVFRAAVHKLSDAADPQPVIAESNSWWWIGAAGSRKADSGSDFYKSLEAECERRGQGTGGVSSAHLLPADVDLKRLEVELVTQGVLQIKHLVRGLIAKSIRDGKIWVAELSNHKISAVVRAKDETAYVAVGAQGFVDPKMLAVIMDAVPGVGADDWFFEPDGALGIQPQHGEILLSAIIPVEWQSRIVNDYGLAE